MQKNDSVLNLLIMKIIVMFAITIITQETIEVVHIVSAIYDEKDSKKVIVVFTANQIMISIPS